MYSYYFNGKICYSHFGFWRRPYMHPIFFYGCTPFSLLLVTTIVSNWERYIQIEIRNSFDTSIFSCKIQYCLFAIRLIQKLHPEIVGRCPDALPQYQVTQTCKSLDVKNVTGMHNVKYSMAFMIVFAKRVSKEMESNNAKVLTSFISK